MKEVKIIVTPQGDGGAKVETFGFKGESCIKASKSIEEALGLVAERDLKPEAFEADLSQHETVGSS